MNLEAETLRLEIGGQWSAADMEALMREIVFLYDFRLYLNHLEDTGENWPAYLRSFRLSKDYPPLGLFIDAPLLHRPDDIRQFSRMYFSRHALLISRMDYASPGDINFRGIGEIVKEIRKLFEFWILRRERIEHADLLNREQRLANERIFARLQLENAIVNEMIGRIENGEIEIDGLAEIVKDNTHNLNRLIEEKKITRATMFEDTSDEAES